MQRIGLWTAIGIGICITLGLLTAEPGYAEDKEHEPQCTLKTLKGRYLFSEPGTALPPFFPDLTEPTPINAAGFHIFNGDGTGHDIVTVRLGGVTVLENARIPFKYSVEKDCTGSYTTHVPPGQGPSPSFGLFIAPDGESIAVITTGPDGNQASDISRRVSRK
jgi:hypothetical protein